MPSKKGRITEAKVGIAVLKILAAKPNGVALIRVLKKELPDYLNLSDEDRAPSETRRNEELWEQQVRNLISHRVAEGNIVAEGLAEYKPGRLRITEAGRLHLKHPKNIQKLI
jgi:hypothetical protein